MNYLKISIIGLLLAVASLSKAQQFLILENSNLQPFEKALNNPKNNLHPSVYPLLKSDFEGVLDIDSLNNKRDLIYKILKKDTSKTSTNKAFKISASPIIGMLPGYENSTTGNRLTFEKYAGIALNTSYNDKLHLNANYYYGSSLFSSFITDKINATNVVPGEGYATATSNGINYNNWSGYLSYQPAKVFNFTLGHGKNFLGNGYRSLLLSDASRNYSFLRIITTVGKFKYVNIFANFKDISTSGRARNYWDYANKYGAFHYLSWNMAKWLNISFFETVIWAGQDDQLFRGFDMNYLNPVVFYRPVEYSIGSTDNSLMGLNTAIKISPKHSLYAQLMMDEFLLSAIKKSVSYRWLKNTTETEWGWWANKQALQFGYRWFDAFWVKGLNMRLEYNYIPPYTYSHATGLTNYGNFNESLAHNNGANLNEFISIFNYTKNSWFIEIKNILLKTGLDNDTSNFGADIYKDYQTYEQAYQNYVGQGIATQIINTQISVSYMVVPQTNLKIHFGVGNRMQSTAGNQSSQYVFGGIQTAIGNRYRE